MKLKGARKVHYESGPDMTPLVDVVMVLLIFLMMVGTFEGIEWYLVSNLPLRREGTGQVDSKTVFPDDEPLEVRLDQNSTRDGFVARIGPNQATSASALLAALEKMRDQLAATGKSVDKMQVVISPSRDVKLQYVIDVFAAAQQAKFQKIGFGTAR